MMAAQIRIKNVMVKAAKAAEAAEAANEAANEAENEAAKAAEAGKAKGEAAEVTEKVAIAKAMVAGATLRPKVTTKILLRIKVRPSLIDVLSLNRPPM
jgi:hypothetical protein